ncbi:hypothetical protein HDU77_006310 [Chytriomyces hyalinus]|nr:hypothetical protein HDU77_006310 [Chytriomyces hyalinus]
MSHVTTSATQRQQPSLHPPAPPAQLPLQTAFAVSQIFRLKRPPAAKGHKRPRLNETMPLTLFYYADENVAKCVTSLAKLNTVKSERFQLKSAKLHQAQKVLLDTLYLIYIGMDEDMKSSRSYVSSLPPDEQRELTDGFSENIYYASQALSKGYRIRGIEQYTSELLQPAKELSASMAALTVVFRNRVMTKPQPPYRDLFPVLMDFDAAWTAFEKQICFYYFSAAFSGFPSRVDETHLFQILMSETVLRALSSELITHQQIESFEPSLILAIPRLSLFAAIYHTPDLMNVTDPMNAFRWFRANSSMLMQAQLIAKTMTASEVLALEKMLADDGAEEDLGEHIHSVFLSICNAADQLIRNKEFISLLSLVFSMHKPVE